MSHCRRCAIKTDGWAAYCDECTAVNKRRRAEDDAVRLERAGITTMQKVLLGTARGSASCNQVAERI